jgi:cell division protein FtsI (penicillin-binding protein 3)
MCVFGLMILYKGATIIFREGAELKSMADSLHTKIDVIQPERGSIFSEDGSLLATSIPQFDLRIDFKAINKDTFNKYIETLSKELASTLKDYTWMDYKEILSKEYAAGNRYFLLKKKATYEQYMIVRKLQPFIKGQNKGGFIAESNTKRVNPYGLLANRVIGLWRKNAENVGIEREFDKYLQGSQGQRIVRCIAGGTWIPLDGSEIDPENGKDVITTLDVNIQDVAENALQKTLEKEEAAFGTCIVMEVKTGKIKAIANLGRQEDGSYFEDFNYALTRLEPGSTFKLVSLISLFRDKLIKIDNTVNCQGGSTRIGPYTINDSHHGLGVLTIKDAFAQSSNVAFAKLIFENYKDRVGSYWTNLHALGLDQVTGLGFTGEVKPYYKKDTTKGGKYTLAHMGMGYAINITPLHTCMVYNTIANNGNLMKPYLVNSIREYGKDVIKFEPTVVNANILDSSSLDAIKSAMSEVVETGTGKALKNPYYTICGKTGTAQVWDKGIKYSDRVYHGSFVGFFPKEDPKYTICVVVRTKKGSSNYYGGQIALPVFKEVANRLYATSMHQDNSEVLSLAEAKPLSSKNLSSSDYNYLAAKLGMQKQVATASEWLNMNTTDSLGNAKVSMMEQLNGRVPNVGGMGLRDAIFLLEKAGLKVIIVGRGRVTQQSIAPGSNYTKGEKITIQLS